MKQGSGEKADFDGTFFVSRTHGAEERGEGVTDDDGVGQACAEGLERAGARHHPARLWAAYVGRRAGEGKSGSREQGPESVKPPTVYDMWMFRSDM